MKLKNCLQLLTSILFFFVCYSAFSQTEDFAAPIILQGVITTPDGKPLEGVNIVVSKDNKQITNFTTPKNGRYKLEEFVQNTTNKNFIYTVVFSKPGYVTKKLDLYAYIPPNFYEEIPNEVTLDVGMIATKYSSVNINRPYGKIKWQNDPKTKMRGYVIDQAYKQSVAAEEKKIAEDPDAFLKDYEKNQAAIVNAEKEKEKEEKYNALIKKADMAFSVKNYEIAKESYKQALAVKANEKHPSDRIAEIDRLIGENAGSAKYNAAIKKADQAFTAKDYNTAKTAYNEALALKPNEAHPANRLKEIETITDPKKNERALYEAAVAKGNAAFTKKDYQAAKLAYQEAAKLRPTEQLPKNKLLEIASILNSKPPEKNKYDEAIKKGNAALATKKYEEAKKEYQAALAIKPNEKYPKDKIAEADKLIAENKAKADADLEAKRLEKERLAKEKAEKERLAKEAAEKERLALEAANKAKPENSNDTPPVAKENKVEPLFDGTKVFSAAKEKQQIQEEKRKQQKKKAENLAVKYETKNMSTSLMDAVDAHDKKNKR